MLNIILYLLKKVKLRYNLTGDTMLKIVIAKTFKDKLLGLINQKNINYGMFFPNVSSIHTFFMKEAIDVIGVDKNLIIKEKYYNVTPNKIIILRKSKHTLELPKGYSKYYKIGKRLDLAKSTTR